MIDPIVDNQALPVNEDSKEHVTIQRGRHDKENPYVMISRKMLRDMSLSPKAKGVLCYLLSLPNNWKAHPKQVAKAMGVSKDQIYTVLKELIRTGYATRTEIKSEKGRFADVIYEFYEEKLEPPPEIKEKTTVAGFPDTDNPDTEKPTLRIKEEKKDISEEKNTSLKVPEEPIAAKAAGVEVSDFQKPLPKKPEFSPKVSEVANQMVNLAMKHETTYRPPKDLTLFLKAVQEMIEVERQDIPTLISSFEWAVQDNEKRGDFNGWRGVICTNLVKGRPTNPAKQFHRNLTRINSARQSQPKRKFAPSSNDAEALEILQEMNSRAI